MLLVAFFLYSLTNSISGLFKFKLFKRNDMQCSEQNALTDTKKMCIYLEKSEFTLCLSPPSLGEPYEERGEKCV